MARLAATRGAGSPARLDGYILKKDSPSCGMERVKVYEARANWPRAVRRGAPGFPLLPVEEEGRLTDPRLRENFIERVFAYRRLRRRIRRPVDDRRPRDVPHRAQAAGDGARAESVRRAGPVGGTRQGYPASASA